VAIAGFLIYWVWAVVRSIQTQRWGWLVAMLLLSGIALVLYAMNWPGPVVTGPLGVDKPLPSGATLPSAVAPGSSPAGVSQQWEYCEIEWYDEGYFAANAVGPHGQYLAARNRGRCRGDSSNFLVTGRNTQPGKGCQSLINELINAVTSDGWQLAGATGRNWWNHKFQRPVTR
jgi:hypothetical protein